MTQKEKVLSHLKTYGHITSWEAIQRYRITRLSEYIRQLRRDNHIIVNHEVRPPNKNWFVVYEYKNSNA